MHASRWQQIGDPSMGSFATFATRQRPSPGTQTVSRCGLLLGVMPFIVSGRLCGIVVESLLSLAVCRHMGRNAKQANSLHRSDCTLYPDRLTRDDSDQACREDEAFVEPRSQRLCSSTLRQGARRASFAIRWSTVWLWTSIFPFRISGKSSTGRQTW
jgi:hypothetical protein